MKRKQSPNSNNLSSHYQKNTPSHYVTSVRVAPLPTVNELAGYERIKSGFAERIITMAEKQSEHRRTLENKKIFEETAHIRRRDCEAKLGQIFAFLIVTTALILGTIAAIKGYWIFGSIISSTAIASIVYAFLQGRKM